jgi:hypothetical protein
MTCILNQIKAVFALHFSLRFILIFTLPLRPITYPLSIFLTDILQSRYEYVTLSSGRLILVLGVRYF